MKKRWISVGLVILLLIGGYVFGMPMRNYGRAEAADIYRQLVPELHSYEPMTYTTARALDADGNLIAYVGFSESIGYGGSMIVGTIVEPSGALREPVVIEHNETLGFFMNVSQELHQYENLVVTDAIMIGDDVDVVSGATQTSSAVNTAVRYTAHSIAYTAFGAYGLYTASTLQFGIAEAMVVVVFVMGILVAQVKKLRKFRLPMLCVSIVVLGFWLNRVISIVLFSSMKLRIFPSPMANPLFYIMTAGAILPIILFGKNLYCSHICPFCGVQEVAHKISGKNISLGKNRKRLGTLRNVLLVITLLVTMVTASVNTLSIEPFGLAFGLDFMNTSILIWVVLGLAVVLSFFFRRLWCVGFCPVGAFLDVLRNLVGDIRRKVSPPKKKPVPKKAPVPAKAPEVAAPASTQ